LSRPFIKFVKCDGCGKREEHPEGQMGVGSQWVPPYWCEVFFRGGEFGTGDVTRHYCMACTNRIVEVTQKLPTEQKDD
jgi:hypothetical protein